MFSRRFLPDASTPEGSGAERAEGAVWSKASCRLKPIKRTRSRSLHQRPGAFIIPNPWDAGSARLLAALGFEALATTSSGFAETLGRLDGEVSLEDKIEHCQALCAATSLPVSADMERGFADDPERAAAALVQVAEAGVVGGSIEDYSGVVLRSHLRVRSRGRKSPGRVRGGGETTV